MRWSEDYLQESVLSFYPVSSKGSKYPDLLSYHLADLYKDPPFLIIGYYNLEVT